MPSACIPLYTMSHSGCNGFAWRTYVSKSEKILNFANTHGY